MKSLLSICIFSAVVGVCLGAVLAYVEVPTVVDRLPAATGAEAGGSTAPAKAAPKAELPETVFEFGNIEQGASMSHAFVVRNVGETPLTITVESTTCKCTVGDLSKDEIAPNEEAEVMLEWVAKQGPGPFRHGAVLGTNDPTQSSINLTVEGQVVESTAMSPSDLIFGTIRVGDTPTASLYLMDFLDQDLKVLDYELSDEELAKQLSINIEQADPNELPSSDAVGGVKVTATYKSGKSIGPFQCWLTLKTNVAAVEKLAIPIAGTVVGDVSIFGEGWNDQRGLLKMGTFSSAKGKRVALKVAVRGDKAKEAKLKIAEVDPPQLKASLGEPKLLGDKLLHVPLIVEIPAGSSPIVRLGEPVSADAHIVLRADDEDIPEIRLRVRFAAK